MPTRHNIILTDTVHDAPDKPAVGPHTAPTRVEWYAVRNLAAAQDTLLASARRPVAEFGLAGSVQWPWDETAGIANAPNNVDWRVVQPPMPTRLTPGNYLRAKVLYVPSGMTRDLLLATPNIVAGAIRITATFRNGVNSSTVERVLELPGASEDGLLPTGAGAWWGETREADILDIWPEQVDTDAGVSADYSEGTTVDIGIDIRGGARVIDCVVYEYPLRHTTPSSSTNDVSAHGARDGLNLPLSAQTPVPQTDRKDHPVHTDRRWGSEQILRVAAQQSRVLGPKVLSWTPWLSDGASYTQLNSLAENDVEPARQTGSTLLQELITGHVGWDPARPGWVVAGSYAQLRKWCAPRFIMVQGGKAVVPVRASVRARWTGVGDPGIVRLQSSATEWIELQFPTSGLLETVTVIGWLESQVAADQATAVLQALAQVSDAADTLDVYGISVTWGWEP